MKTTKLDGTVTVELNEAQAELIRQALEHTEQSLGDASIGEFREIAEFFSFE